MYADVTSYLFEQISRGGFTSILQNNALQCGDGCEEMQNAVVIDGSFGEEETLVLTNKPSQKPTRRRSRKPRSKTKSKPKSGKVTSTGSPTLNFRPSQEPTQKPSGSGAKSGKAKSTSKSEDRASRGGDFYTRKRHRIQSQKTIHFVPAELPSETSTVKYTPLRKRFAKAQDHQVENFILEQLKEEGEILSANPISLPAFPTGSHKIHPQKFDLDKKRIRDHLSIAKSPFGNEPTRYQPLRERVKDTESNQIMVAIDEA
eukprot:CAMPEP_0183774732 /NCGR_PEP_ID=MMETSP0739-20130205/42698_1 /TAXON_ID=385413 /ORGANISM="Thalassiosira miniscula, Strain CCMP1093" /LENGTH=258 /DNA_ID=CAMNT_0026016129 /DNA_START=299 /DNA_END=1075 /DNA_ORIENTATION=+